MHFHHLIAIALTLSFAQLSANAQDANKRPKKWADPILVKYDKDKDGLLSRDERKAWRADRRAAALKQFDANNNGKLEPAERKALVEHRAKSIVKALDRDGDGKLSRKEVGKARGIRFERLRRGFERIDANGDDSLTAAELGAMAAKAAKRRHKRKKMRRRGGAF